MAGWGGTGSGGGLAGGGVRECLVATVYLSYYLVVSDSNYT